MASESSENKFMGKSRRYLRFRGRYGLCSKTKEVQGNNTHLTHTFIHDFTHYPATCNICHVRNWVLSVGEEHPFQNKLQIELMK